jgi:hypothetical protein
MRMKPVIPALALLLLVSACAGPAPASEIESETELDSPQPRLAVLHDDGLLILDATTLAEIADVPADEATRVAEAGDGRHVMLTTETGFSVLDGGAWTDSHGDHGHSYAAPPRLLDVEFPMSHPGHVVPHYGVTALFSDGDGTVTFFDPDDLVDGAPSTRVLELAAAHHGVALELSNGIVLTTAGDEDARRSIAALDIGGTELARTDECPDVHGETVAAGEVVVFGCSGSVVAYEAGAFRSIALPDKEAGVGDLVGVEDSNVVLADYSTPEESEPTQVALLDVESDELRLVDLPAAYYYWSLARSGNGNAVVLTIDGALQVIDPESGEIVASIPVIDDWTAPEDWQDPAPSVTVLHDVAYVTDPASNAIHAVELESGTVIGTADLGDTTPHSLALVRG